MPGRAPRLNHTGAVLITVLLFLVPLILLLTVMHQRVTRRVRVSHDLERQLYSLTLAANGVEVVRTLLPALDLGRTSLGPTVAGDRNPVPRRLALTTDVTRLDGMLPPLTITGLEQGHGIVAAAGEGRVLVRLTNNPEEEGGNDEDGIIIVRSMGVTRAGIQPILPSVVNCVTIVESRLRRERGFEPPAAVLLLGASGRFQWSGSHFRIQGGGAPAVAVVSVGGSSLMDQLAASVQALDEVLVSEGPRLQDVTTEFQTSKARAGMLSPPFWVHLVKSLPHFVFGSGLRGLRYLPDGGTLDGRLEGVVISRGPIALSGHSDFRGLFIHLGGGPLELRDEARIVGGLWLLDPDHLSEPNPTPLELRMGGNAQIIYNPEQIEQALWLFPPTQLGWRIISPEMEE